MWNPSERRFICVVITLVRFIFRRSAEYDTSERFTRREFSVTAAGVSSVLFAGCLHEEDPQEDTDDVDSDETGDDGLDDGGEMQADEPGGGEDEDSVVSGEFSLAEDFDVDVDDGDVIRIGAENRGDQHLNLVIIHPDSGDSKEAEVEDEDTVTHEVQEHGTYVVSATSDEYYLEIQVD